MQHARIASELVEAKDALTDDDLPDKYVTRLNAFLEHETGHHQP